MGKVRTNEAAREPVHRKLSCERAKGFSPSAANDIATSPLSEGKELKIAAGRLRRQSASNTSRNPGMRVKHLEKPWNADTSKNLSVQTLLGAEGEDTQL